MALTVFHSAAYNATSESFDTLAKADVVAATVAALDDPPICLVEPRPADRDELSAVHDTRYLDALAIGEPWALANTSGMAWDERLLDAVAASTGGVRDAAIVALSTGGNAGSLSSGLHHAKAGHGDGYCTVNGLVVAARAALAEGAARVLVLDLDAHCGGGTAQLIDGLDGVEQIDVSVSAFDTYASRPDARLTLVDEPATYLDVIERELEAVATPGSVDLVIYNAGMDPHEHAGGRPGITTAILRRREEMVVDWAAANGVPVAFTLAGGYAGARLDLEGVARLHLMTITAAAGPAPSRRCTGARGAAPGRPGAMLCR
jgi:acetoin utilization deacetylase AcuC-like enzyme